MKLLSAIKNLYGRRAPSRSGKERHPSEHEARVYLEHEGLLFLTGNYSCRYGEVDLIMRDAETLVFVEVKYRRSADWGGAINAVTTAKQQKIIKTAQTYLLQNRLIQTNVRFDVVAITHNHTIDWIKNAFSAEPGWS